VTNSSNLSPIPITVVKSPIITDKSTSHFREKKYSFKVDRYSNKPTIKAEIEYLFNVKVIKINTCRLPRKKKRVGKYIGWKPQYKKAIVTLAADDAINLFKDS
jgi:large subunit ribosomal protein L23